MNQAEVGNYDSVLTIVSQWPPAQQRALVNDVLKLISPIQKCACECRLGGRTPTGPVSGKPRSCRQPGSQPGRKWISLLMVISSGRVA